MIRDRMLSMAMICVILGATGLAFGLYSAISVQTGAIEGEDGDDGDDGVTAHLYDTPTTPTGSVFIRWGNKTAPEGTTLLYSGIGFVAHYNHPGTPKNPIVIKDGDPGGANPFNNPIYPLATAVLAPGITADRLINAAVCYSQSPTQVIWGTWTPPTDWHVLYKGYAMGGLNNGPFGPNTICVESEYFDASNSTVGTAYGYLYPLDLANTPTGYTPDIYIKSAVIAKDL